MEERGNKWRKLVEKGRKVVAKGRKFISLSAPNAFVEYNSAITPLGGLIRR